MCNVKRQAAAIRIYNESGQCFTNSYSAQALRFLIFARGDRLAA